MAFHSLRSRGLLLPGTSARPRPAEDFRRDSDLFAAEAAKPEFQGRIAAAMKRGFQTKSGAGHAIVDQDANGRHSVGRCRHHAPLGVRRSTATPVSRSDTAQSFAMARSMPILRRIGLRTGGPLLMNNGP